jgi:hypothetical protein
MQTPMKYSLFYPSFKLRLLPQMLGIACLGAMVAGSYGILHDQVTYSISSEYFTKMKFDQFHDANLGLPPRILVSEIGFLATWWVGFFSAWFIARVAVPAWPPAVAMRKCLAGFSIMLMLAFIAALIGYGMGVFHSNDDAYWNEYCQALGITDIPAFVRVAYIHNASYLGGLAGLVVAICFLLRQKKIESSDGNKTARVL